MANNGNYRMKDVVITKNDSGGVPEAGYPVTYSMVDATTFTYEGAVVTDNIIANMLDGSVGDGGTWLDLVEEFRSWVEGQELFLFIQPDQINLSYGVDHTTCPVTYGDYF